MHNAEPALCRQVRLGESESSPLQKKPRVLCFGMTSRITWAYCCFYYSCFNWTFANSYQVFCKQQPIMSAFMFSNALMRSQWESRAIGSWLANFLTNLNIYLIFYNLLFFIYFIYLKHYLPRKMSIAQLLQAAEYLERRERGKFIIRIIN